MAKKSGAKPTAETPRRGAASDEPSLRASASPRLKSSALVDTADALTEADAFFRRTGKVIVPLTLKDILEEQLARKLV